MHQRTNEIGSGTRQWLGRLTVGAGAFIAAAGLATPVLAVPGTIVRVARSGETAAGADRAYGSGIDGVDFVNPVIGNDGVAAFVARLAGDGVLTGVNDRGVFSGTAGMSTMVARAGSASPMGPGAIFMPFDPSPVIGGSGGGSGRVIAFNARLTGDGVTSGNDSAIFHDAGSGLGVTAREGNPAAGLGAGVNYGPTSGTTPDFSFPLVNDAGVIGFRSALTGPNVTNLSDGGVWRGLAGGPGLVIRENTATGISNVNFGQFLGQTMNGSGALATLSALSGSGTNFNNDSAIYLIGPGAGVIASVAREGNAAPGGGGATFGGSGLGPGFGTPGINNGSQVVFRSTLVGSGVSAANNSGVWAGLPGAVALIRREGTQAPMLGAGVVLSGLDDPALSSDPVINGSGVLGMVVRLSGTGIVATNDTAIYSGAGLETLVAREGSAVPGLSGVNFGVFNEGALVSPSMNFLGQMVFTSNLTGAGVTGGNDGTLFGWDPVGGVCLIAREGDVLDVNAGFGAPDLRTIASLRVVLGSGGQDGRGRAINDMGQIVFAATFTDGTGGVFITSIPSPGSLSVLGALGVLTTRRSRRR